jgi:hypothetical protein
MIISFNNHFPNPVDHYWPRNLPLTPEICAGSVFDWLLGLNLSKDEVHTIIMPGVREGLILVAYHAVMGHFPNVVYSMREDGRYVWIELKLQEWREGARSARR